jgi:uncharacterized protein (TIGR02147 family)
MEHSYQGILKQALAGRCERNPRYSLRAFARDLDLSPSYLCEILKGTHRLKSDTAKRLASKLALDRAEKVRFELLVRIDSSSDGAERARLLLKLKSLDRVTHLDEKKFAVIGSWKDLAAMQAMFLKDQKPSIEWLATKLGQSVHWAEDCVRRLKDLALIETSSTRWIPTFANLSCESSIPSKVIRNFHKTLLRKAAKAIDGQIEERRNDALILAIKADQVKPAFERLKSFCQEFDQEFGATGDADKVYALAIQFFPLQTD